MQSSHNERRVFSIVSKIDKVFITNQKELDIFEQAKYKNTYWCDKIETRKIDVSRLQEKMKDIGKQYISIRTYDKMMLNRKIKAFVVDITDDAIIVQFDNEVSDIPRAKSKTERKTSLRNYSIQRKSIEALFILEERCRITKT